MDILTLACLTGIVPQVFCDPADARLAHGAELVGMARWQRTAGRSDDALALFRRSIELGLPDDLLFRTLWDIGCLEKKQGREDAALAAFSEIATCRNPWQAPALEELAKHYEHRERNYSMATYRLIPRPNGSTESIPVHPWQVMRENTREPAVVRWDPCLTPRSFSTWRGRPVASLEREGAGGRVSAPLALRWPGSARRKTGADRPPSTRGRR
jgi:hypothetical protein